MRYYGQNTFLAPCLMAYVLALLSATHHVLASPVAATGVDMSLLFPPEPESVHIVELPLPPVSPSNETGACTLSINPHGTGCIGKDAELRNGNFLPDNKHIVASVTFAGAPDVPQPGSAYSGVQLIVIKTDGRKFPNGDAWKCITCGIPTARRNGSTELLEYPQAFRDGRRVLAGNNIVDCGGAVLSSPKCVPERAHIYPIYWTNTVNGSGPGGAIRENRIHPDNVHMGFSSFTSTGGVLGQFAYFGRLVFNPFPVTGEPRVPRYELHNVTRLYDPAALQPFSVHGGKLTINPEALSVGELRGFSGSGDEIIYVGANRESCNTDIFAANIDTGHVRRITQHPGYADPIDVSPDNKWSVILDTRSTNRTMFMAAMRGIPPLTDLVSSTASVSIRNNGQRRFFQPWLLDSTGDRGEYLGQQLNAHETGSESVNDPEWNAQADPRWSWDGTQIAYYQRLTVPPQCGGLNPLPCPASTSDGERSYRIMLATLTARKPVRLRPVKRVSDVIPWGVPYVPGDPTPVRWYPPGGAYTVYGRVSGYADVTLIENSGGTGLETVAVSYHDYSDAAGVVLTGSENVTSVHVGESLTLERVEWYSDLTSIGPGSHSASKVTSEDGFHLLIDMMETEFVANGTLTSTVDKVVYGQPENYT
ncbi:TolB family protein [Aspergillus mulundensis]|uniref:Saponin hydrolase n=1 Tax=Aspergillus mulundensis TaxID=1810919 RepID=A0A3D8RZ53_9EURO|nr:Uncharacterized protein DSM5745_06140 [Aspergillus mulundensis]RDW79288.1 Uncharacterized protein DSM5745_06140 [Aspergillus mulundensis]